MSGHVVSSSFVDDVARFGGTASQINRLRASSSTGTHGGPEAPPRDRRVQRARDGRKASDRFLLWLAGVNYDLASRSYVDRTRHATIGFAVLTTALMAGSSLLLVLTSAGVDTVLAVPAAVMWTVLITTLERALVASATRRFDSFRRAMATTLVGFAIAALVATAVAQPLMLRVFQPEIEQQIRATRLQEAQSFRSDTPALQQLQARVEEARQAMLKAQQLYQCELDGTCGTWVPGHGQATSLRRFEYDRARAEYDRVGEQYEAAFSQAEQDAAALSHRPVGLLEQLRALNEVARQEPTVATASMIVTGMFIVVEMLPLLLVALMRRRGATLYEKLLAIQERSAQDEYELDAIHRAGARRLADDTDPQVDDVLRRFEEQRDEISQLTRATLATVVQLAEERAARRTG
ncbi:DUF4407 domain-containing protein [Lentzea nigeriaca]|uniref:DUF4407 domain-containing protein n=1 Tax=Lentzea nigeriaca TaxID=1128665 RepID=UPI00195975AB|nr:DUF4407 domain-containing protein [Lentzea nigeriaca]MBM7857016.1 hypothetical protein [Lentzea nigeriaca]